jgi:hypothetical protein
MPYAQYDASGNIIGLFSNQETYATAFLPDSDPAVVAFRSPPQPRLTCQLWQLQAVMTPAQWTAAQSAIGALNNPTVSAFFSHPGAQIPASSSALLSLGAAIGLTADQVKSLVQQAAAVTIP